MLKTFWRKQAWRYLPGGALLIACAWIGTRSPLVLGRAIELASSGNWDAFSREAWSVLWIALGVFVTRFSWRYFIIGLSRDMEIYLRDSLYEHLMYLPISFYGKNRSGDLMAYAVNDVGSVRMMFGMVVASALNALSTVGFSVAEMTGSLHPKLTLLVLLPIPFAIFAVIRLGSLVQRRSRRSQELFATISGHVQENINGMRVLKAFAQEKAQYEDFEKESLAKREATKSLYNTSALLQPVIQILFALSYMAGIAYGGQLVVSGEITLGDYVAFNAYLALIVGPVQATGRMANMLQRGMASYKRLSAILSQPEIPAFERQDAPAPEGFSIEARNLRYQYEGGASPALEDVSFTLPEGGVLGLAGATGSGKTTLAMLLLKLLAPERGQLFLGGRDATELPARAIRDCAGYVPQDGFLFNESIRQNVDFFSGADEDSIRAALEHAGFSDDLAWLSEGLDTLAGERGNHLSGGQRQRVALARAFARKPKLLILDDTLSAVDAHTEGQILASLKRELGGRTAIIIAHRLSALADANEILFLDKGRVIERGTHEQLLARDGAYAAVYRAQKEADAQ